MTTAMPELETERLRIRPFVPDDVERVATIREDDNIDITRQYVLGTMASLALLASLYQPPYGERAVVRKDDDLLIGMVGLVPCLMPFEQLPYFNKGDVLQTVVPSTPEVGLYWACDPDHQRQGYATEAARAVIDYAFANLNLKRVVATTEYDNIASQGVMRKLEMTIDRNPLPEPTWFQMVGILEHKTRTANQ